VSEHSDDWSSRLDNPVLVQWEYASEERLRTRNAIYRELTDGETAEDAAFTAVAETAPRRVLDVGCGTGDIAARIVAELGVELVAVDLSTRMVQIARERGLTATVADVQQLPFADGEFDCVLAAWLIYHVPDRPRAIWELARVLAPGGTLVAVTLAPDNLAQVWELIGAPWEREITFDRENGAEQLAPYFESVERRDVDTTVTFPDAAAVSRFIAAQMTRAHMARDVPAFEGPFRAEAHHTLFVARKAG